MLVLIAAILAASSIITLCKWHCFICRPPEAYI